MTSKCVAILCLLFGSGLPVNTATCKTKTVTFSLEPMCDVQETFLIDFEVKSIEPREICNSAENVCLRVPARVVFMGTFSDGDILSISGFMKDAAQLPVAEKIPNRRFAEPLVALFLNAGNGEAAEVPANQPLKFALNTPMTIDDSTGCTNTASGQPCNGFCCVIVEREIHVWGKKPQNIKALYPKTGADTVYIPTIVKSANDVDPTPLLLQVPAGGTIAGANGIELPFLVAVVKIGQTELTSVASNATSCGTGITKCYKIDPSKMPSAPITYTIKGTERMMTYTFGNAGNTMKSCVIALVMVTGALFASGF